MKLFVLVAVVAALVGATTYAQAADIGLTKGVTPQSPNIYRPGDTIHYVMTVTNLHGSENIEITQVEDLLPDGTLIQMDNSSDPAYPALPYILGAGATQTYLLDWVIPPGTSGYVINDLRCVGVQHSTVPDNFDAHVQKTSLVIDPCIEVTKEVECGISKVGDEVLYHICVTNCGDTDLLSLTVVDDVIGDLAAYFPYGLLVGETACADIPYVIQSGDADPLINTATATAEDLTGYSVSDYDTAEVDLIHPSVEVVKECLTPQVPAGGNADFGITITNTGDCTLIVTTTEADMAGPYTILAGDFYYAMVTYPDPGGVDCVYNEVTVTWTLPAEYCNLDNTGTAWDEACCDVVAPCIEVTKVVECDISKAGDEVIYHICVTNCGDTDLMYLTVVDDVIGDLVAYFPPVLAAGQTTCAYVPYVIQADDPDPLVNVVTATAENAAGTAVSDYATEEVDLIHPSVEVVKECLTPQVPAGGNADFGITITNTGDCTLIVTTTEADMAGPYTILAGDFYYAMVTYPDPGGVDCVYNEVTVTWTLPAEYCNLDNTGTAWDEACCDVFPPCIEVTKEVNCDISKAGDEVIYHICVTNCSELELFSLTVVDDVIGDLAAYFPSGLLVGETACADIPYVIQADDPDPLVNVVTATAENAAGTAVSDYATEEVDLIHPSVEVVKECLTPQVPAGGNADFGITITNTGDCTLIVTTTEADMAGPYTILAGDFYYAMVTYPDPGGVDCVYNEVTVTWTLPAEYCNLDNTGTAWDEACCDVVAPCIEVTKVVECDISKAGDEVLYHICVTNCTEPPAPLFNLTVIDDVIGDLAAYFPAGLAVGETACADIPYVIQVDDPDPLVNVVTVTAENAAGTAVSDYATEEVDLIHPSVEVFKECLTPQVPAGGNADFGITITNTGDCTLIVTTTEADMAGPYTILAGDFYYAMVTYPDPGGVDCVYNEVTVTWTLPAEYCNLDNTGTAWDEACCDVVAPCIEVTKVVECDISKAGDEVIYHICVTNCSVPEAPLVNLTVMDDVIGDISSYFPPGLAGGETACADVPYVIQVDDPDPLVNVVTVTAENEFGTSVSDYATEEVDLIHPSVEVSKECLTDPVSPGGDAQFGITITNTGDCTLIVTTTETEIPGPLTILAGASYTDTVTRTDPGGVDCVYNDITVTWTLPAEYCNLDNTGTAWAEACCPIEGGEEGCTPGFWKNHHDCWCDAYDPGDSVDSVFTVPSELSALADDTLYDALKYGGGGGVIGAARNLLRSAVSALLNACSSDIAYPMSVAGVIADVNAALATLDRGEILALHATLDTYNNYGCSIDAHCNPIVDPDKGGLLEDHGAGEISTPSENKEILSTVAWSRSVPNPFSDNTRIQFYLPTGGSAAVDVYDVTGRHVASLLNDQKSAGSHEVVWNGRSSNDDPAPAGVYFYTLRLDNETLMKKIMLVR